jgi:hypothetical protein
VPGIVTASPDNCEDYVQIEFSRPIQSAEDANTRPIHLYTYDGRCVASDYLVGLHM